MRDQLFDSKTIAAGTNATSKFAVLQDHHEDHAIQYTITGDGTCSIEVFTSIEGEHFISNGVKGSGLTKTSGPGSDGKDILPLSLKPGDLLKVKVTETGGVNSVVVTIWLVQK